ncbi:MAG: hypothetical protein GY795_20270 [Desulfobacterales bacterium]|nr:hypothetical protein [Desulfobacterales bacterium]
MAPRKTYKITDKIRAPAKLRENPGNISKTTPSVQEILDIVSRAVSKITPEMVHKSFRVCEIDANGAPVPRADLHSRLLEMINPDREMLPLDSDGDICDDSEHEEIVSIEE